MDGYQIINNSNAIKEPTHGYQNCNSSQILVFGGYLRVRGSLYTYYLRQYHSRTILTLGQYT